jgi:hypothetical protein
MRMRAATAALLLFACGLCAGTALADSAHPRADLRAIEATTSLLPDLPFDKTPHWQRRLETLGHEGLPFARLKQGRRGEVFIGITRDGILGFSVRTE